jgi:hypothetical protein
LLAVPAASPDRKDTEVAAIAAGLFAVLDPGSNNGLSSNGAGTASVGQRESAWKKTARIESLGRKE